VEQEEWKETTDVEKRGEGNKREAGRYIVARNKEGEENMKGMWGFRGISLQEKTELTDVDVKEPRKIEESTQEMEKVSEGKMDERRAMGEARKEKEMGKLEYKDKEEKAERILEASEVGLEQMKHVDKKRKQKNCVDTRVEKDIGENVEVPQANTTYTEEKAGDKKSKGKIKLPDDGMKHRLEGDHAQDTKERSQGSQNIELKIGGSIRIYRYTGRHDKYEESS
jgi:hypothetical protein